MIGLLFLGAALLWLALSAYLAMHMPKWFGISKPVAQWLTSAAVFLLLMVGPFVDHIVGMRQFEKLCDKAQLSIRLSPTIENVTRARTNASKYIDVPGYFVNVQMIQREYLDINTGQPFLTYETYFTHGGRVGGLARLGADYSCDVDSSPRFTEIWKKYSMQKLMDKGNEK